MIICGPEQVSALAITTVKCESIKPDCRLWEHVWWTVSSGASTTQVCENYSMRPNKHFEGQSLLKASSSINYCRSTQHRGPMHASNQPCRSLLCSAGFGLLCCIASQRVFLLHAVCTNQRWSLRSIVPPAAWTRIFPGALIRV
jgi:hypothetical protein